MSDLVVYAQLGGTGLKVVALIAVTIAGFVSWGRTRPAAAYLLGAACGLEASTLCCWRAYGFWLRSATLEGDAFQVVDVAMSLLNIGEVIVYFGLLCGAFWLVAQRPPSAVDPGSGRGSTT